MIETETEPTTDSGPLFEEWPAELGRIPASWKDRSIPPSDDPIWDAVEKVFSSSWFQRVWIIQETVAASNVMVVYGESVIDWSDLHAAMEIVNREAQVSDDERFTRRASSWEPFLALAWQREWEAGQFRWALISLLENFRHVESTLARDRFFALLGLATDGNEAEFEPDYDSPLEAIVLRVARVFVRQGRGMQLLYRAGLNQDSHRFPSWIPDWTKSRQSCLQESDERLVPLAALDLQEAQMWCIPNTDELVVEGYAVDVIEGVSRSSNTEAEWNEYFREIGTMLNSTVLPVAAESRDDLRWKVPIAGIESPSLTVSGGLDMKSSYRALREYLEEDQNENAVREVVDATDGPIQYASAIGQLAKDSHRRQRVSYIAALQGTVSGWKFVVTKRGFVGVLPNRARVGDIIAVLKGGSVPFIFQKSVERPEAFRLVGECYIQRLMYGEAMVLEYVAEKEFRIY
jgi:hypothetical protein